ncbi:phosphoesterase RecJ domain-containing protein [Flavonifractor sp. An82]|uniref:DHH family phosphoesterase n=1 Tax=Flavonifractor sp. An82 TaxID=1965660 RepID=UPI000B384476|nr:DHH family phosphoesterase [Flavonifractor sp. An82]OUN21710.1 phosphoesterase RecJ domain-containing protein [Flavonifractor sp. An82]
MTYTEAAAWLRAHDRYLILTHKRPDGDTIGCAAALCRGLRGLGKTAHICPGTGETHLFTPYLEGLLAPEGYEPDTVVSVDIAARGLFTKSGEPWLERGVDLAIDHHPSQEFFAKETCLDAGRAACGEIIYEILNELGQVNTETAVPLYVAVSTDTGCFQYGNTTADTHRVAAALMATGIDVFPLNKRHFRTKTWARLQVERLIVERMHRYEDGKIAVAPVSLSLMDEAGATEEDMEDIAAFLGQIEGVETSVTIRELEDGACKLSVRTSGGLNATKVCALLGGGGHAAAAGCTINGTLEQAESAILDAIRQVEHNA